VGGAYVAGLGLVRGLGAAALAGGRSLARHQVRHTTRRRKRKRKRKRKSGRE
jgi:hypothetical protein